MHELTSYLAGDWHRGSGSERPIFNPSTEEQLGSVDGGGLDMAAAYDWALSKGVPALAELSFAERGALLKALSKKLYEHRDELIDEDLPGAFVELGEEREHGRIELLDAPLHLLIGATRGLELLEHRQRVAELALDLRETPGATTEERARRGARRRDPAAGFGRGALSWRRAACGRASRVGPWRSAPR